MNKILCCYRNKIAIEKDIALAQRRGCLHEKVQFQGELAQFYLKSGDVDSAIEVYKKILKTHRYHQGIVIEASIQLAEIYCHIHNKVEALKMIWQILPITQLKHRRKIKAIIQQYAPLWIKPMLYVRLLV